MPNSFKSFFRTAALCSILMAATTSTGDAQTSDQTAHHCTYLYAAGSSRMAEAVVGVITDFEAYDQVAHAHEAVQLAINLQCPIEPMIKAIECTVDLVIERDAAPLSPVDIVQCVEDVAGQQLPKFTR